MIWWVLIIAVAGVATCPIMFASWWTDRRFRVCCYLAMGLMGTIIMQAYRARQDILSYDSDMKKLAVDALAAGASKCEVVRWGYQYGFVASQMSEAVGMAAEDAAKC
jgi:hypothetical protein